VKLWVELKKIDRLKSGEVRSWKGKEVRSIEGRKLETDEEGRRVGIESSG
jgi:hypothetical protein